MINTIFFGINILLLIAIWNFMLKKTLLDHYRDQLFDLREEARTFFLQNDIPLDSTAYKNLRDLLNAHLRFTELFTFFKFIYLEIEIKSNKGLQEYLKDGIEKQFATKNPTLEDFTHHVREKAKIILLNHMINSSGIIWLLAFAFSPFVIAWNLLRVLRAMVRTGIAMLANGLFYSLNKTIDFVFTVKAIKFVFTINAPLRRTVKQDLLEECSYRVGTACFAVGC